MSVDPSFNGVIGRLYSDSREDFGAPASTLAAEAPNVVVVVLDDVGFADLGCYGSEIDTPAMDRLGREGAQYNNFHVTAMCSPTRACVLTGRNAHSVGLGVISEWAGGFPGYQGKISDRAATMAEIQREHGYCTLGVGKWHLTPMKDVSAAGPYGNWPLGRGFDRWYGFQGAFTDQWNPELYEDNHPIETPQRKDYHLSVDLVDRAIAYVDNQQVAAPDRPFFLYLAFGACHWPHHVPAELIDKYAGRFAAGWDVVRAQRHARQKEMGVIPADTSLPPSNPGVARWADLSEEDRRFCERSQALYAGFVEHTDREIGRFMAFLEARGICENTLVVLLSDNGASPEGGPLGTVALNARKHIYHGPETAEERREALPVLGGHTTYPHYAYGWAQASNTPLQWYKMNTYGGGVRAPLLMHWPKGITKCGLRQQFHHAIDLLPTVLDVLGLEAPARYRGVDQIPVQGTSMRYTFTEPDAMTRKRTQFFELNGDRAIWKDGWKAVTHHKAGTPFENDRWGLYHLDRDFSECNDLAAAEPEKLRDLVEMWWREAETLGALPLDDRWGARSNVARGGKFRQSFTYRPGLERIDRIKAPDMSGRRYRICAEVDVPDSGCEGVLLAFGTSLAGYVLYVLERRLVHEYVFSGRVKHVVRGAEPLRSGRHRLEYWFDQEGEGAPTGSLVVDGRVCDTVEIPRVWPNRAVQGGLTCGRDSGLEVSEAYRGAFPFTGEIRTVTVDIGEPLAGQAAPAGFVWPPPQTV